MYGTIKFTKREGWGYAVLDNPHESQGLDIFIHANELLNIRWKDLEAGDRVYIKNIVYNGRGYNGVSVTYIPSKPLL